MTDTLPYLLLDPDGPPLTHDSDVNDLLSQAWAVPTRTLAIPVARLGERFFDLASGLLGAVAQKFQNYETRLAIVGDVSGVCAKSRSLRDFVHETNGRDALWFVADEAALRARLGVQP